MELTDGIRGGRGGSGGGEVDVCGNGRGVLVCRCYGGWCWWWHSGCLELLLRRIRCQVVS